MAEPNLKFALSGHPDRYTLPQRPAKAEAAVVDAHRQTGFLLSDDLTLFERTMNTQLDIVGANRRARDPSVVIMLAYWSRVFYHLADACQAACLGSYPSCAPLLRPACDCLAVERALVEYGFDEADTWASKAVGQAKGENALAIDIGRFRAASILADDEVLGRLYRIVSELTMPSFGTTVLQTGPDVTLQRASVSFGEGSFHLAWAELCLGWLLTLAAAQLEVIAGSELFAIDEALRDDIAHLTAAVRTTMASSRRCYVEERDGGAFLLHNYRRTATGQPKRILLR